MYSMVTIGNNVPYFQKLVIEYILTFLIRKTKQNKQQKTKPCNSVGYWMLASFVVVIILRYVYTNINHIVYLN